MDLKFNFDESVAVITITGTLNASNAESLKSKFLESLSKTKNYIMDLSGMDFVDSTGLGAIVACLKYAVEKSGTVKIANLQSKPKCSLKSQEFTEYSIYLIHSRQLRILSNSF